MKKILVMGLALMLCCTMVGCRHSEEEGDIDRSPLTFMEEVFDGEQYASMYPISIDGGEELILPFPLKNLLDQGWSLCARDAGDDLSVGMHTWETILLKDEKKLNIQVENQTYERQSIEDCQVVMIRVPDEEDYASVTISGVGIGDSEEDMVQAFGDPDIMYANEEESYRAYIIGESKQLKLKFDPNAKNLRFMSLEWIEP